MRYLIAAGLVVGSVLGLSACNGTNAAYPANVQTNFLNACEGNGGSVSTCGCTLSWFESHRSLTQFMADEDAIYAGSVPADVTTAEAACNG
jgi:hypothetical protein